MTDLLEDQWEIDGLVIGRGRPVAVEDYDLGDVDARTNDTRVAGGDGTVFGYDYHDGRTITLEVFTDEVDAATSRAAWRSLESIWRQRGLRYTPRQVMPLRTRLAGDDTVVAYGRPRKLTPASLRGLADGVVAAVATFDAAHAGFYGDTERMTTLTLLPDTSGGLTLPEVLPATLANIGNSNADQITNSGDADTWPVVTFHGPIANPEISWVGTSTTIRLVTTLASDRSVTIDPRPWVRSIVRDDGASLAGAKRGVRLEDLRLPPGVTEVAFRGQDAIGTSSCVIRWRDGLSTP